MKNPQILLTAVLGLMLVVAGGAPAEAMDTDVYLRAQTTATTGAPDVLILLDNSGSMNDSVPTAPAYDSSIDYCSSSLDSLTGVTGATSGEPANCSSYAGRIYYTSGGTAPQLTSSQWFTASKVSYCLASQSAFQSSGFYTGDYIAYWGTTNGKWSMLTSGGGIPDSAIQYVDCHNDNSTQYTRRGKTYPGSNPVADGMAVDDGLAPAGSGSTPYITSGSGNFIFSLNSTLALYASNYLAYLENPVLGGSQPQPKITIAKNAVVNLINSNKSVRFGLMIFNVDSDSSTGSSSSGSVNCLSDTSGNNLGNLGCSGGRVIFRVDDMDDARRTAMTTAVQNINAETWTPLSESLYEAYRYYAGMPVMFGNDQYAENPLRDLTAETYTTTAGTQTNGTTVTINGSPYTVDASSETYTSPLQYTCQKAYVIIVTDGDPTHDTTANGTITKLLTGTSASSCSGLGGVSSDCLDVLAGWMHNNDVNSSLTGPQTVGTYTIGFGTSISSSGLALLKSTAQLGGGTYSAAQDAPTLTASLIATLNNIQQQTTTFSAPSLSINSFNKQFNSNYIYLSLFMPASSTAWYGNVKKYRLCTSADISAGKCTSLTDVLDENGNKVTDSTGAFVVSPTPWSYWSPSADGSTVNAGGAGANIPAPASRTMYTYMGSYSGLTGGTTSTAGVSVSTSSSNTFYQAVLSDPTLLGLPAGSSSTAVQNLVNWILGQDSYNPTFSSSTPPRWAFADALHSAVTPVVLGKDSSGNAIAKLFVATNDGVIHMINESTGVEEWSFLPQEMYSMQYQLSQNPNANHLFGVDSTPTVWVQDINQDGIVEPNATPGVGDHVYLFIGMRRGGRDVYAFDVTPDHTLTSQTDTSTTPPKLMWVIQGGTGNFTQLGQTWSQPQIARVRYACPSPSAGSVCDDNNPSTDDSKSRLVLMFAGGYDPNQDNGLPAGPDSMGNAIYMVDPFKGSLIWWASTDSTSATLKLHQMLYSIPSDLRLVDTDNDGTTDRIYVGDTGGQLWRIDLGTALAANTNGGTAGYVFADIGCGSTSSTAVLHQSNGSCPSGTAPQDLRKFFYPPERSPVNDATYSTNANYDLITIGSGDREDPLDLLTAGRGSTGTPPADEPVHNRLYAFRDYNYQTGVPATVPSPLTEKDLYDATANLIGTDTGSALTADISNLQVAKGWYINLEALTATTLPNGLTTQWIGEKVLSPTTVINGALLATTYTPANSASSSSACQASLGVATEYALNALNATAADGVTTGSGLRAGANVIGSGIPSGVVIDFRPDGVTGLIGASNPGGLPSSAQGIKQNPVSRSYWYEQ